MAAYLGLKGFLPPHPPTPPKKKEKMKIINEPKSPNKPPATPRSTLYRAEPGLAGCRFQVSKPYIILQAPYAP